MADLGELKVPAAMRPVAEQVITLTDKACAELLDEEYADLARHVVGKLARKRPSPLLSGRAATWAGGIVWALGQVNFAFDRESKPHVTHDELAGTFGLNKLTLSNRAKQVRDTLKMSWATCEMGSCISWHADPAALGEADARARAIGAGWRIDAFGRLACPRCQQTDPGFWATGPVVPWDRYTAVARAARAAGRGDGTAAWGSSGDPGRVAGGYPRVGPPEPGWHQ